MAANSKQTLKSATQSKPTTRRRVTAPRHVNDFVEFLRQHAIVGLAIGLVLGTQVKALVDQLNASFVTPIVSALIGDGGSYTKKQTIVHIAHRTLDFTWGAFLYAFIDFIAVMATLFAIIKIFKLDKLDKPNG